MYAGCLGLEEASFEAVLCKASGGNCGSDSDERRATGSLCVVKTLARAVSSSE